MSPDQPDVIAAEPPRVPGWRRWVIAGILAAGLAAALIAVVHQHGRAASRVLACGHGLVPGYSNHRSYPPGIPTLPPPGAHLVSCFASIAQAAGHGFATAAPAGTLVVHGVFLEPTGSLTVRQCRAAARTAGFAVPCPTVAPVMASSPIQLPNCDDGGGCSLGRFGFIFFEEGFAAPPGYHGRGAGRSFVLLASGKATVRNECAPGLAGRSVRLGGTAAFIACPPYTGPPYTGPSYAGVPYTDALGGDVVLGWVHQDIHVLVGFQGVNPTNLALDLAVAHHLVWIAATSEAG